MMADHQPDRCPDLPCKARLMVDAYGTANNLTHDRELLISPVGPESGQRVICVLGHGPWMVKRTAGTLSYYAVSA